MASGNVESPKPGGLNDVTAEFSLSTGVAINEMYHLSDFLLWLEDDELHPQLVKVPEAERAEYGVKGTYVTQQALYERYVQWVKQFGDRFDRLEQLSLVDFNRQLTDNHGFVRVKSGKPRWEGYRLAELSLAHLQAYSGISVN